MIEKREKEWQELEQKALQMLDNPISVTRDAVLKFYLPILRLWFYPSFAPYKVWVFSEFNFKTIRPKNLKVIEAVWDRDADYQRLNKPLDGLKEGFQTEPKLIIKTIEIERDLFESICIELKQIKFSAFASDGAFGIDGEHFGIETFRFSHTKVSWWSVYPKEWQNLVNWFEKISKFLEGEFSKV